MAEGVKLEDRWGYYVATSSQACVSAINSYYHQVLIYGRERSVILEAVAHDKHCVLANILAAHFLHSSGSSRALTCLHAAKSNLEHATLYEKLVFDAISYMLSEDRDDDVAVELHSKLLKEFPRDLVSLKRAQVICFYMGLPGLSLSLIQKVLPHNEGENFIYGMLAFPLLELGRMEEAEKAAKRGFEINKQDSWAQHALCHVLQYKCCFREAVKFMEECSSSWGSSSFMLTHNWWHVALCYLEGNAPRQRVLEIYDNYIWKELDRNDSMSAELYVRGELDIIGDRLKMLAECLTNQENWYMEWHFDVLIVWTLAKTGEISKAEDLLKGLKNRFLRMTKKKQQRMQRGMMLAEALYAYGIADDRRGLELLDPDFDATDYKIIGASDEQVDVFNEVWYNMLLNIGNALKAIEVLEKQIKKRDGVPYLWRLLERAYKLANKPEERIANEKATALESRYFN
ncbi:Tetratricopeptide repeat protein 38 [Glycine max]|uniref:tetratricopeptide repeat protein 38-like isoform X2 n=1 Tax=Glycine soja TaxID=3848 RepID=UPI0003DEB7F4|nr:tetratricopeptide repeat protein 38-like isoform X2 [Glycine soja]XP_040866225.1 tetratricopeptide repeat protein 38 isoform X3 [Glycine max]KAH1259978.1 Tetratricopeptide repeat protein 38 [Glycine max]